MGTVPVDDGRHLVLMGMMGGGKSSVGRRPGLRPGRQFLDTDKMVPWWEGMDPKYFSIQASVCSGSMSPTTESTALPGA